MVFQAGTRNLYCGLRVGKIPAPGSVAKRQIRFPRFLDPIETRPRLPVPLFGKFDGFGHRCKFSASVVAFDSAPFAIGQAAQVDFNHRRSVLSPRRIPWRRRDRHPKGRTV